MHKLLHRRSLIVKNKVEPKKIVEDSKKLNKKEEKKINIEEKKIKESILKLICLFQLENNLLIDEIIPSIAFKFSKIGKVKIEFYQSDLTFLTDDSIYTWNTKNNNYKTNNIEINVFGEEYKKNKNLNDFTIILVDNDDDIKKYFLMHNSSVLVEKKDNTNKIIIDKKNNSYSIFNPFTIKPNEVITDFDFYTISKQNLIKKMLNYKVNEIFTDQKENYKLFVEYLDYLKIESKLRNQFKSEFEQVEKNKIHDFLKKINKHFKKQYNITFFDQN